MKLLITAPAGKMGRLVVQEARKRPKDFTLVGALGNPAASYTGQDISAAAGGPPVGALVYAHPEEIIGACDGVIDFSTVERSMEVVAACVKHRKPLLLGTTGFSPEQEAVIAQAGQTIPLSLSHNTSKAVNLVYQLLAAITRSLGPSADIDIVDMHDNQKRDAPSGTAKTMGQVITQALSQGDTGKEIAYHSIRSGNIASTHTVIFGLEGERIELTHHAYDYTTFAKGALDGILFLLDKPPGRYSSQEILGLDQP